ncbi:MAG: nitroreductase family protein, partial [Thermoanaerobaculia bacterium]
MNVTLRKSDLPVHPMFVDRWSRRAFSPEPIDRATLSTLFEAARWSPSSMNEQPWFFLFATAEEDLERFRSVLVPGNRTWADHAPVLVIAYARKNFSNDRPNRWAGFDTGAAWMSLALQAHHSG